MRLDLPLVYGFYAITVDTSIDPEIDQIVYRVTNNETGVVEAETSSLPRAILSSQSSNLALLRLLGDSSPSIEELLNLEVELDHAENGSKTH